MICFKKYIFLVYLLGVFSLGCKRQDSGGTKPDCPNFYYKDYFPNLILPTPHLNDWDSLAIDVDRDGTIDLAFYNYLFNGMSTPSNYEMYVYPRNNTELICPSYRFEPCDSPLIANTVLDSTAQLFDKWTMRIRLDIIPYDQNFYNNGGYIGMRITRQGKKYLGWIYVQVKNDSLFVDKYALSSCADRAILVGER
jgi:hypothetical protein